MSFPEILKDRTTDDLNEAAASLLVYLNDSCRGGNFSGSAVCFAVPLADVLVEIGRRKRFQKSAVKGSEVVA